MHDMKKGKCFLSLEQSPYLPSGRFEDLPMGEMLDSYNYDSYVLLLDKVLSTLKENGVDGLMFDDFKKDLEYHFKANTMLHHAEGDKPWCSLICQIRNNPEAFKDTIVWVTGKIVKKQVVGKVTYLFIQDNIGLTTQVYVRKGDIDEEDYNDIKQLEVNTLVSICGDVFRTKKGEVSIKLNHFGLFAESVKELIDPLKEVTAATKTLKKRTKVKQL